MFERAPWFPLAACQGKGHLFYPPADERPGARRYREQRASYVCAICPVIDTCRAWAREHREFGYWGGESEADRAEAGYSPLNPIGRATGSQPRPVRADRVLIGRIGAPPRSV